MLKLLIVFAFVPAIFALTPVRQCNATLALPDGVFFGSRETPCLEPPCQIPRTRGFAVTYVDFTTLSGAVSIMPRVRATVFGTVTITQELPDHIAANPCGILTEGSCPLSPGQRAAYRLELPVAADTPLISSDTEISLLGDNGEIIFCYRLNTVLVQ